MTMIAGNGVERMQHISDELQLWLNDLTEDRISQVPDHLLQSLITLTLKMYAAKLEDNEHLFPFSGENAVTVTELLHCVTKFMEAVDVEIFELGMFQAWTHSSSLKNRA